MKRKMVSALVAAGLASALIAGCGSSNTAATTQAAKAAESAGTAGSEAAGETAAGTAASEGATAGVIWYNFADTFIANARQCLNNVSTADGTIKISDADSQNDITVQDNNLNNFLTQKPKYLVINNINNPAADSIAKTCNDNGIVAIFANTTSPSDDAFAQNENLWYVSSVSTQSGENMGNAIVDYFKTHENWDRNGNGKVDFILLQGMQTFSDTINRSSYSLATIEGAGFELGKNIGGDDVTGVKGGDSINGVLCNFSRSEAQTNVEALIANYGDDIDCILADNDDEALGAIAALQAHGYFTDESNSIPVVGVDATVAGCESIKNGTLLETSLNNPVKLAKSIYKLMYLLEKGEAVTTESIGIDGVNVEGHKILINYISITKDNVEDASYDINDTSF
ncbi:MAG: substrate-binding domain-containing protein [Enterocloster asparagiformis]|nr:substrate-binding domain-containing protein [Enterocloster asparagiformis]